MAEISTRILVGDCIKRMRKLPNASVHMAVTSPPYFNLRDYGVDGQIGLEETPEQYVTKLVRVFREVKRVLRDDGTLWLNIGDSYSTQPAGNKAPSLAGFVAHRSKKYQDRLKQGHGTKKDTSKLPGIKHKELIGIPWMLAFALRADGWYLRQDIIWAKNAVMPESITDRCTKAHEYVFLLTKKPRYFYDHLGVAEPAVSGTNPSTVAPRNTDGVRNKRSVWTINPKPFKDAHFAVMPVELAETCIKAGTSEKGVCPKCGAGWLRIVKREGSKSIQNKGKTKDKVAAGLRTQVYGYEDGSRAPSFTTVGWKPSCSCKKASKLTPIPAVVLDPFGGAGTTAVAAMGLKRSAVLTELNPKYAKIAKRRLRKAFPPSGLFSNFKVTVITPKRKNKK